MSRNYQKSFLPFCVLILIAAIQLPHRQNQPPVVSIKAPKPGSEVLAGRQMYYDIEVSDKEDGETAFQEIESSEVFLELVYFQEEETAAEYADRKSEAQGLSLVKSSLCFNCHAANSNLAGPPFREISHKYAGQPIKSQLIRSIKTGSKGKWDNVAVMPAHPHISDSQISQMVDWIIALKDQPETYHLRGTSGGIFIDAANKGAFVVLKATYRDHGDGEPDSERIGIDTQWHSIE